MLYRRLSTIRSIDERHLKTSSKRNFFCHSHCNETSIQVTPKIDSTNVTDLNKSSKTIIETIVSNVKTVVSKQKKQRAINVYKSIKADWTFNATAAEEFRRLLENKCKTSEMCLTSQDSVKINDTLKYTADNDSILMTSSILDRFPKESPYKWNSFKKCSIVGSSGILLRSKCGKEIDSADFIIRFNLAKTQNFTDDVGSKTSLITCNPTVIETKYYRLAENMTEKFRQDIVTEYGNTTLFTQAFNQLHCTPTAFRAQDVLQSAHVNVVFPHPSYRSLITEFWNDYGIKSTFPSSGLTIMTSFLSFCQEVHMFGFWPFQVNKHQKPLPFHYYEPKHIPRPSRLEGRVHNMPSEFNLFKDLHNKGIIRLHVDKC
ncbi:alpha-2,8-sialyltransferase 8E-like isoform X2 [Ptychodera flava]